MSLFNKGFFNGQKLDLGFGWNFMKTVKKKVKGKEIKINVFNKRKYKSFSWRENVLVEQKTWKPEKNKK